MQTTTFTYLKDYVQVGLSKAFLKSQIKKQTKTKYKTL